jgi:hypothetical protein
MSVETWNLIADGRSLIDGLYSQQQGMRLVGRRLSGGPQDGVEIIEITFGELQFTVVPTRGMGLWRARLAGTEFGWDSPVRGPVHPCRVPLFDPSGLGWLEGFDEMMVRCGLVSNGAPEFDEKGELLFPLHGQIANRSAYELSLSIDHSLGELALVGKVEETRFHFQKLRLTTTYTCRMNEPTIFVKDVVENFGGKQQNSQLLYHWNFGPPLLEPGARVVLPAKRVVPRDHQSAETIGKWDTIGMPGSAKTEFAYFTTMHSSPEETVPVMIVNQNESMAVLLEYEPDHMPCFTLWKNEAALTDGYVVGLEPGTNWPNPRSFEEKHDRIWNLEPGQAKIVRSKITFYTDPAKIANQVGRIDSIRRSNESTIETDCDADWCSA